MSADVLDPGALPLDTPTGVILGSPEVESDEWFMLRRNGITATDLSKIMGLSKYGNAVSVWLDKRGELPDDEAGESAHWGHILEDPVAQEWARRRGVTVEPVGVIAHAEHPWMRVSLDRLPSHCPDGDGPCAVEIKTRSAYVAGRWRDDVPDDVLAQAMWQLAVTGFGHVHVPVLLGGQKLQDHRVDFDEDIAALLITEARRVWDHVLDGTQPPMDVDAMLADILDRWHTTREGSVELTAWEVKALVGDYVSLGETEKQVKEKRAAARSQIVAALGEHEVITVEDVPVVTYKLTRGHESVDWKALLRKAPEVAEQVRAAGVIKTSADSRRINIKEIPDA